MAGSFARCLFALMRVSRGPPIAWNDLRVSFDPIDMRCTLAPL